MWTTPWKPVGSMVWSLSIFKPKSLTSCSPLSAELFMWRMRPFGAIFKTSNHLWNGQIGNTTSAVFQLVRSSLFQRANITDDDVVDFPTCWIDLRTHQIQTRRTQPFSSISVPIILARFSSGHSIWSDFVFRGVERLSRRSRSTSNERRRNLDQSRWVELLDLHERRSRYVSYRGEQQVLRIPERKWPIDPQVSPYCSPVCSLHLGEFRSPSAGKLLHYTIEDGGPIEAGQVYAEIEVMKMVSELRCPSKGK